jgi:eukaryotic-like serine/threonine-protein kinase
MIDRYKILEQLGEGGAGSVYKAWDTKLQRHVAVKSLLPPARRTTAGAGENLSSEASALSALQHPNIVAVYDLDTDGPEPFVVMEFINGETLEATVRRGAMMPDDFQQIAGETLEGLMAAHRQGMCHRDLKPSNLMFHWLPDGKWQTKLLDFGLANFGLRPAQQQLAGAGTVAGSVYFMAPEQFLHEPLDVRTDLYSAGCLFYYALTGSYPCDGATVEEVANAHLSHQVAPLHQLRPDVPRLITDWVMWLMSRQPQERPETAEAALKVLRGIQNGTLTSLPTQRVLKTQPVPRRAAVVAAPLSKDAAARARAGIPAAAAVSPAHGVASPAATRTTPGRTGASTKKVTAGRKTATGAKKPAKPRTPFLLGVAAAAIVVGTGAWYFAKNALDPDKESNGGGAGSPGGKPATVEVPGGPPPRSLLIWFDASTGARKDAGKTPARTGDRIDHWDDRAPLAGNNAAQYHASGSPPAEKERRRPTLMRVTDKDGLKGTHDIMMFNGDNCLVFGRDRDKVGDPVAKELSGNQLTWIAVFSAAPGAKTGALLAARVGKEARAWDTFVRDGKIYSGIRKSGGADNHASLPFKAAEGFHIVAVIWDGAHDRLRQWVTTPDGKTAQSTAISGTADFGDLSDVRLGALNSQGGPMKDFLKGGIASLVIYNRPLEDSEREAAVDYFARRYFGKPATKP